MNCFMFHTGKHFRSLAYKHQSMHDWLLDHHKHSPEGIVDTEADFDKSTDLFAIGFEELVDLNTSNIISTRFVVVFVDFVFGCVVAMLFCCCRCCCCCCCLCIEKFHLQVLF